MLTFIWRTWELLHLSLSLNPAGITNQINQNVLIPPPNVSAVIGIGSWTISGCRIWVKSQYWTLIVDMYWTPVCPLHQEHFHPSHTGDRWKVNQTNGRVDGHQANEWGSLPTKICCTTSDGNLSREELHTDIKAQVPPRERGQGWRPDCSAGGKEQSSVIPSAGGAAQRSTASIFIFQLLFF